MAKKKQIIIEFIYRFPKLREDDKQNIESYMKQVTDELVRKLAANLWRGDRRDIGFEIIE